MSSQKSSEFLDNPFVLAPMAGITDMPFRRLIRKFGAGCVISEFVSSHAVLHKNPRTERYLAFHEDERKVAIQLFGGDEAVLVEAAKIIEDRGVDFIDLNLGCPVPKVTKKGGGSAWLNHPIELGKVLALLVKNLKIPLTIKIRTGWTSDSINAHEICRIAYEEGVHWVAIHGRTRAQGYAGQADWDYIEEVAERASLPVLGNGDVVSGLQAAARYLNGHCAGVMIGRGALKNPWIFDEANVALKKLLDLDEVKRKELIDYVLRSQSLPSSGNVSDKKDYYTKKVKKLQPKPVSFMADWVHIRSDRNAHELMNMHLEFLREAYSEERVRLHFRKFLAWYSAGYPGSHEFRKYIFNNDSFDDIYAKAIEFFEMVKSLGKGGDQLRQADPVLMKGHG